MNDVQGGDTQGTRRKRWRRALVEVLAETLGCTTQ